MKKEKQRKTRKTWKEIEKENENAKTWKIDKKKRGAQSGTSRGGPKNDFYIRALIGNREAIEAKKYFEHPRREE